MNTLAHIMISGETACIVLAFYENTSLLYGLQTFLQRVLFTLQNHSDMIVFRMQQSLQLIL